MYVPLLTQSEKFTYNRSTKCIPQSVLLFCLVWHGIRLKKTPMPTLKKLYFLKSAYSRMLACPPKLVMSKYKNSHTELPSFRFKNFQITSVIFKDFKLVYVLNQPQMISSVVYCSWVVVSSTVLQFIFEILKNTASSIRLQKSRFVDTVIKQLIGVKAVKIIYSQIVF